LELHTDALEPRDVVVVCAPKGEAPVLVSYRKDSPVDQIIAILWEKVTDHAEKEMSPSLLAFVLHVLLDGESDDPLSAKFVSRVLPLWADALLEHEEVSVWDGLADHINVVEHAPEVLHLG